MPWVEESVMRQRLKLVEQLKLPGANVSSISKRFGVSRKTAYKWLNRFDSENLNSLGDKSKAPISQPNKTTGRIEELIISTHQRYPDWGPSKIRSYLINVEGKRGLPSHTTFGRIFQRCGLEVTKGIKSSPATKRFERDTPNALWQMDFKGSFMTHSQRCYPLTILDDYSRFSIGLEACQNEKCETVKSRLVPIFHEVGLPKQINVDNGNPWGSADLSSYTSLQVWFMKLGIIVSHSSPYHPQTNGKIERFHRTLQLEVVRKRKYEKHEIQRVFDKWKHRYNYLRPHDALDGYPPAKRYVESNIPFTGQQIHFDYTDGEVRKVTDINGLINFRGEKFKIGKAFCKEFVAVKETDKADEFAVYFMDNFIKKIKIDRKAT